jgi:hypothetical protein
MFGQLIPAILSKIIKMKQPHILKIAVFSILSITHLHGAAQSKKNDLNSYFSALAKAGQFNGNVLVAENGKIVYQQSFGYSDFSNKTANTSSTASR